MSTTRTPKKETLAIATNNKRGTSARQKNAKSRAILSTESSSSDEEKINNNVAKMTSPAGIKEGSQTLTTTEKSKLLSPIQTRSSVSPRCKTSIYTKNTICSSDDDNEDDNRVENVRAQVAVSKIN